MKAVLIRFYPNLLTKYRKLSLPKETIGLSKIHIKLQLWTKIYDHPHN